MNRAAGLLLLDTDETVEIDTMFGGDGQETDDPAEAVTAVAPLKDGSWISVDLTQFESVGALH